MLTFSSGLNGDYALIDVQHLNCLLKGLRLTVPPDPEKNRDNFALEALKCRLQISNCHEPSVPLTVLQREEIFSFNMSLQFGKDTTPPQPPQGTRRSLAEVHGRTRTTTTTAPPILVAASPVPGAAPPTSGAAPFPSPSVPPTNVEGANPIRFGPPIGQPRAGSTKAQPAGSTKAQPVTSAKAQPAGDLGRELQKISEQLNQVDRKFEVVTRGLDGVKDSLQVVNKHLERADSHFNMLGTVSFGLRDSLSGVHTALSNAHREGLEQSNKIDGLQFQLDAIRADRLVSPKTAGVKTVVYGTGSVSSVTTFPTTGDVVPTAHDASAMEDEAGATAGGVGLTSGEAGATAGGMGLTAGEAGGEPSPTPTRKRKRIAHTTEGPPRRSSRLQQELSPKKEMSPEI